MGTPQRLHDMSPLSYLTHSLRLQVSLDMQSLH